MVVGMTDSVDLHITVIQCYLRR